MRLLHLFLLTAILSLGMGQGLTGFNLFEERHPQITSNCDSGDCAATAGCIAHCLSKNDRLSEESALLAQFDLAADQNTRLKEQAVSLAAHWIDRSILLIPDTLKGVILIE